MTHKKIGIVGAWGYLGTYFRQEYPLAVVAKRHLRIDDRDAVESFLDAHDINVLINCAGSTGRPNVDWCESHRIETLAGNVTGPLILLDACLKRDIRLVHISSGCIYEGDNGGQGYRETDPPNFHGSFYSRTKIASDQFMSSFPHDVLNLRLRMPFDGSMSPRNLITKLRHYPKVLTAMNSMTYIPEFMTVSKWLIEHNKTGTFNIVNRGSISPHDIMDRYRELVDPSHEHRALRLSDLEAVTLAGRSNCILNIDKLTDMGIWMSGVDSAIEIALLQIKGQIS